MPTYEYTCRDCGHTFEIVQAMTDDPLSMCPECGGSLRKVFAPPAISFKGSGFYATDHGKRSKKQDGEPAKGDGKADMGAPKTASEGASGSKGAATDAKASSDGKAAPAAKERAPK